MPELMNSPQRLDINIAFGQSLRVNLFDFVLLAVLESDMEQVGLHSLFFQRRVEASHQHMDKFIANVAYSSSQLDV
jgi:hypothetical protein